MNYKILTGAGIALAMLLTACGGSTPTASKQAGISIPRMEHNLKQDYQDQLNKSTEFETTVNSVDCIDKRDSVDALCIASVTDSVLGDTQVKITVTSGSDGTFIWEADPVN